MLERANLDFEKQIISSIFWNDSLLVQSDFIMALLVICLIECGFAICHRICCLLSSAITQSDLTDIGYG